MPLALKNCSALQQTTLPKILLEKNCLSIRQEYHFWKALLKATNNMLNHVADFPEVHWVVQFDCPKQLDDYIHRVGRTARAEREGRAITFLLPSEVKLVELLAKRNVCLRQQQ